LQLLVTNEGRKVYASDSFTSPEKGAAGPGGPRHKKKVVSKPIENLTAVIDAKPSPMAMTYEYTKQN
jgi:hypothetical protein